MTIRWSGRLFRLLQAVCLICMLGLSACQAPPEAGPPAIPPAKDLQSSYFVVMSRASAADFTLPFYREADETASRKYAGSIPDGRTGYISQASLTSMVILDDIVAYYKNLKQKKIYVRDFETAVGRRVIVSDNPDFTIFPDGKTSGATTIVLSRSSTGFTDLVYTSFRAVDVETAIAGEKNRPDDGGRSEE